MNKLNLSQLTKRAFIVIYSDLRIFRLPEIFRSLEDSECHLHQIGRYLANVSSIGWFLYQKANNKRKKLQHTILGNLFDILTRECNREGLRIN